MKRVQVTRRRALALSLAAGVAATACALTPQPSDSPGAPGGAGPTPAPQATPVRAASETGSPASGPPASVSAAVTRTLPVAQTTATAPISPQRPTPALMADDGHPLALTNGVLIDGTGAGPLAGAALVIQSQRIVAVGLCSHVTVPAGARVIDVGGATILPGFFNAHIHQGYNKQNLLAWAQAGVTTVRDLGGSAADPFCDSCFAIRSETLADNRYARLVAAGPMVTVPGGYPIVPWGGRGLTVLSPDDAASKVTELLVRGADIIKIALDSGGAFGRTIPVLSQAEASAIVRVAHQHGTVVSAHILTVADLRRALDAGVDDVAHMAMDPVPDDLIKRTVQSGSYWVPTIELWKGVGQGDRTAMANLGAFYRAGGRIALGTDFAGYSSEFDLGMPIRETGWMNEAGMSPMDIIVAATRHAARVSNLGEHLGTLEAGKIADVLVVNGDPLQDLQALLKVRLVVHNGAVIRELDT